MRSVGMMPTSRGMVVYRLALPRHGPSPIPPQTARKSPYKALRAKILAPGLSIWRCSKGKGFYPFIRHFLQGRPCIRINQLARHIPECNTATGFLVQDDDTAVRFDIDTYHKPMSVTLTFIPPGHTIPSNHPHKSGPHPLALGNMVVFIFYSLGECSETLVSPAACQPFHVQGGRKDFGQDGLFLPRSTPGPKSPCSKCKPGTDTGANTRLCSRPSM